MFTAWPTRHSLELAVSRTELPARTAAWPTDRLERPRWPDGLAAGQQSGVLKLANALRYGELSTQQRERLVESARPQRRWAPCPSGLYDHPGEPRR